ncbi:MAG: pantetheine-phosphate adenylyltransferase [Clostridia bacterium]|nr:pantetheine-phosphate adenylyltransferase [Clostridia bacterium]
MRVAVFPGSFDPITNGHLDIIRRASRLFDQLVVAVLVHPTKPGRLPLCARADMIRRAASDLPNVRVEQFSGLLAAYAVSRGAQAVIRGLRSAADFAYEAPMAWLNGSLEGGVETLFMLTSPQYAYISSSAVREIAALGGDISKLVPDALRAEIRAAYKPAK